jgi:hypothetical protein
MPLSFTGEAQAAACVGPDLRRDDGGEEAIGILPYNVIPAKAGTHASRHCRSASHLPCVSPRVRY